MNYKKSSMYKDRPHLQVCTVHSVFYCTEDNLDCHKPIEVKLEGLSVQPLTTESREEEYHISLEINITFFTLIIQCSELTNIKSGR